MSAVPYRSLSFFYILYFAVLGCIAPYWGLYLQSRDFNPQEIGTLMAGFALVRILAPNLWAALAHRFRSPLHMVRAAALLMMLCFAFVGWVSSLSGVLLAMVAYGFFWAAILPQYEAITMQALANRVEEYSRIRVWGSVGFVAVVLLAGILFDFISVRWLPVLMFLLMAGITVNSWLLRSRKIMLQEKTDTSVSFLSVAFTRPVLSFLLMTVFLQISHGPYYTFFSIYLESKSFTSSQIGLLWAVGVIAEVILFWQFRKIINIFSWSGWCMVSLALTAVRWLMIALLVDHWLWLFVAQTMHAFSFGAMHVIAMRYVQHFFPGRLQGQGQALYSSLGFGLGGAIGAWLSGQLWEVAGDTQVFLLAGLSALAAMVVVKTGLKDVGAVRD